MERVCGHLAVLEGVIVERAPDAANRAMVEVGGGDVCEDYEVLGALVCVPVRQGYKVFWCASVNEGSECQRETVSWSLVLMRRS